MQDSIVVTPFGEDAKIFLIRLQYEDEKGNVKYRQVPLEQCSAKELTEPSDNAINYWKHYGIDRKTLEYIEK